MKKAIVIAAAILVLAGGVLLYRHFFVYKPMEVEPPPTEPVGEPVDLYPRWKTGDRLVYRIELDTEIETEMPEQEENMTVIMDITEDVALSVTEDRSGGGHAFEISILRIRMKRDSAGETASFDTASPETDAGQNPLFEMMKSQMDRTITFYTDARGRIVDQNGMEPTPGEGEGSGDFTPMNLFQNFFSGNKGQDQFSNLFANQFFPDQKISPGHEWPMDMKMSLPGLGKLDLHITNTFEGYEVRRGVRCAMVKHSGKMTLDMDSSLQGKGVQMDIDKMTIEGKSWIDPKNGHIIDSNTKQLVRTGMTFKRPGGSTSHIDTFTRITMTQKMIEKNGRLLVPGEETATVEKREFTPPPLEGAEPIPSDSGGTYSRWAGSWLPDRWLKPEEPYMQIVLDQQGYPHIHLRPQYEGRPNPAIEKTRISFVRAVDDTSVRFQMQNSDHSAGIVSELVFTYDESEDKLEMAVYKYGENVKASSEVFVRKSRAPKRNEPSIGTLHGKAKDDLRALAVALECFFMDHNTYPSPEDGPGIGRTSRSLTTPIAYFSQLPYDPFQKPLDGRSLYYAYYAVNDGWILISTGPDGDFDIDPAGDYSGFSLKQPSSNLVSKTYDPTNGAMSDGDIYRIK